MNHAVRTRTDISGHTRIRSRTHPRSWTALAMACALPLALACTLAPALAAAPAAQDEATQAGKPASMSAEDKAMMDAWIKAATPGPEHARLAEHFAGSWDVTMTFWMKPDAPMTERGAATITAVFGGRQLRQDFKGAFMGMPFEGTGLSGYDNVRQRYTSSWADNMSTSHMLSHGDYDDATRTYTFASEMADPMHPGTMLPIRETVRVIDADHHVMEMFEQKDGKEVRTMQLEYKRAK